MMEAINLIVKLGTMGIKISKQTIREPIFDAHKCALMPLLGFLKVASHSKAAETLKYFNKPPQESIEASKSVQDKIGCEIYTSRQCKPIPKGDAIATEVNHVLG